VKVNQLLLKNNKNYNFENPPLIYDLAPEIRQKNIKILKLRKYVEK